MTTETTETGTLAQGAGQLPTHSPNSMIASAKLELREMPGMYRRDQGSVWRHVKISSENLEVLQNQIEAWLAQKPTAKQAMNFSALMIGRFRAPDLNDPKIYAATMGAIFAAHALGAAEKICDAVTGLHTQTIFLPSLAELTKALEAEEQPLVLLARSAKTVLESRREEAAEQERRRLQDAGRQAGRGAGANGGKRRGEGEGGPGAGKAPAAG